MTTVTTTNSNTPRQQRQLSYIGRLTTKNLMLAIETATESQAKLNVKANQVRNLQNIQDLQTELFRRLREEG